MADCGVVLVVFFHILPITVGQLACVEFTFSVGVIFLGVTSFTGVGVTGLFAFVAHCMLSATISVLGIEVHAGIRGAERSFCASFFCGAIGLVHFCHSFTIGDFSIG